MKIKLFFLFVVLYSTLLFATSITHQPSTTIYSHKPIKITARIPEAHDSKARMTLYYRMDVNKQYQFITMPYQGAGVFELIFTPKLEGGTFSYYLQLEDSQTTEFLPAQEPELYPYRIPIQYLGTTPPTFTLIYPKESQRVESDSFQALISIEDPDSILDPSTLKVSLDQRDVSSEASLTDAFLSVQLNRIEEGFYTMAISVNDYRNQAHGKIVTFKYFENMPSFLSVSGLTSYDYNAFDTTQTGSSFTRKKSESIFRTQLNFRAQKLHTDLTFLQDSRHTRSQQPLNRFQAHVYDTDKRFDVFFGDFTPYLSNMSLSYTFVHGYDVNLDLLSPVGAKQALVLRSIRGSTKRAISLNTPGVTQATYEQRVLASQLQLNVGNSKNSINYLKINDDLGSLNSSPSLNNTPVENHVLSIANQFRIFKTNIKWETAASVYYNDMNASEVEDVEELELPVKGQLRDQLLETFPAKSSLIIGYGTQMQIQRALVENKVDFTGEVNYVAPGYTSLGSAGVQKDVFSYGGNLSVQFFNGYGTLSGGLKTEQDNVLAVKQKTTYTDTYTVQASGTIPNFATVYASYSAIDRINKTTKENGATTNIDIKNNLNSISVGLGGIQFNSGRFNNVLNLNYSFTNFDDDVSTENTFETHSGGLSIQSRVEPFTITLGTNLTNQISHSASSNSTLYSIYSGKIDYEMIPNKLSFYAGADINTGVNKGQDLSLTSDTKRTTYTLGGALYWPTLWSFKRPQLTFNWSLSDSVDNNSPSNTNLNFTQSLFTLRFSAGF